MKYLLTHALEHWAGKTPDHPAFRFNGKNLGYAGLWRSAGRLARVLMDNGVRRGDRVGIYMNKCLQTPITVYGVMRAGAAFVPLDANAPAARLRHMISHCGIRVLVTHPPKAKDIHGLLDGSNGLDCVIGTDDPGNGAIRMISWDEVDSVPENPPDAAVMEQDLAYIMYTSGSTGLPKGIMHTHYSGLSYARLAARTYGLNRDDRLGNHSPLHFDMSTLDYFAGPLVGATTVIIPEAYTKLPASLSQLVEDEKLTIWYSVPYALIQLLLRGVLEQRDTRSIRWVLFGGEPFPPKHLYALMELWPRARFSNVYGPAEVNQCTYYHVPGPAADINRAIPIGRVWEDTEGLIVDDDDRPVADGEAGELLIRAPTMMRGYWGAPELNAAAFYKRRVTADICDRFYRTGDLVVVNSYRLLDFLGRKDRQVKIRGYRVELDEIENVLASHSQVEESGVYALPDDNGSLQIEAAVIVSQKGAVGANELRTFAAGHLPAYALPAMVSIHASLPRTTSGKVDRRALQAQALQRPARETIA